MVPAALRPLLLAAALLVVLAVCKDAGSTALGTAALQPSGGGGAAAARGSATAAHRPSLHAQQQLGRQPLEPHVRSLQQAGGSGSAATDGGPRCPPLSREVLAARAHNNTVMLAVANEVQWDFALNWLHFIKKAGIGYYVVAAADAATSERLAAAGEPCFEWIEEAIPGMGLEWGSEGWRRMTWTKVFIVDTVAEWGFDLVVSDVDAVWFRDPLPLFAQHPHADIIFSTDIAQTINEAGDEGLDAEGNAGMDVNTGELRAAQGICVYLMRAGNGTAAWAHAWRAYYDKCPDHDQMCAYDLIRQGPSPPHPQEPRVHAMWGERVWMGVLPPSLAMNAHTLFLQQLHKVKKVQPYVVHVTWTYNGVAGKRARLRDLQLWADPPAYYSEGSFVTVDLQLPEPPPGYNAWNENEDMVAFHLASIHAQLQQAYVGWALAAAAGRAFILPQFVCYCEKIWYGVVRCRVVSAQEMPLPVPCPQDYLFHPGQYSDDPEQWGPPVQVREASFLENERTPSDVKDSVLLIQPSATLDCGGCVREEAPATPGGPPRLLVPPVLRDDALLPLLEPYRNYRVWRLSFDGVGSPQRAFGGFADGPAAAAFDKRMAHVTTDFCCRREEEAPRYHKEQEMRVLLNMTSEFSYSPRRAEGSGGGATARRL